MISCACFAATVEFDLSCNERKDEEHQMNRFKYSLGLGVLVVGVAALGFRIYQYKWQGTPAQPRSVAAKSPRDSLLAKSARNAPASTLIPLKEAIASIPPLGTMQNEPALRQAATAVLEAYFSPNIHQYLELMEKQGIEPSERIAEDPQAAQGYWDQTRALLTTAKIDYDGIAILHAVRHGQKVYPAEQLPFFQLRRDNGRAFLKTLKPTELEVAELRLPGSFPTADGTTFLGDLIIQLTYNVMDNIWVLTEFRLSGVPVGASVSIPPL